MKDFFEEKLKTFLHDPIDKCLDIKSHIHRSKRYAEKIQVSGVEEEKGSDQISSCMERSFLPPEVKQNFNEIRHPFCEGKIKVDSFKADDVFKNIEQIYDKIGSEISHWEDKNKFFYLWRNLQDKIFQNINDENFKKYLSLLPADTRVPEHSIWEHLKITSAINAFWDNDGKVLLQNNSLLLFTIGPVQSFVSQARKVQDFFIGSMILSYLTFKAMEEIVDTYGPTNIIYPDLYKQPLMDFWIKENFKFEIFNYNENLLRLPTIPNRFVAILPTSDEKDIVGFVEKMKNKIKSTVEEVSNTIWDGLRIQININNAKEKINSQLLEFPEIYWVAVPWKIDGRDVTVDDLKIYFEDNDNSKYKKYKEILEFLEEQRQKYSSSEKYPMPNIGIFYEMIYSVLEKSIGARKNLREFSQPLVAEKSRKCSVCGERDVVFYKETENKNKFKNCSLDLTNNEEVSLKYLTDGEGLCTICFIKRTFEIYLGKRISSVFQNLSFPSIAEVACADFKFKVLSSEDTKNKYFKFQEKVKEVFKDKFPNVEPISKITTLLENEENLEGSWFYEENLDSKHIMKELELKENINEQQLKGLKEYLKNLTESIGKPNPYYAILYLDGDYMGKWLSGELLPDIDNAYNSEVWKNLPENFKSELKTKLPKKLLTPAVHSSVSTALRNYSIEFVKKIVEEEHLGKLVYAGGDDVLAFVNLKDLFDVMQKLRWSFSGQVRFDNGEIKVDLTNETGFVEKDGKYILTMGPKATLSMGVVIAHYKTPLQIVIKKVFETEKVAKGIKGKNGFAIRLTRHSGEERIVKAKWIFENEQSSEMFDTIELLKELITIFDEKNENGHISKSFIQKVALEFSRLKDENGKFVATENIFNEEVLRLLNRSFNTPEGKKIEKEDKKSFIDKVWKLMTNLFWNRYTGGNIDNFINFNIIATFINKVEE